jgi:hypothetical protein
MRVLREKRLLFSPFLPFRLPPFSLPFVFSDPKRDFALLGKRLYRFRFFFKTRKIKNKRIKMEKSKQARLFCSISYITFEADCL